MNFSSQSITNIIEKRISKFKIFSDSYNVGKIISVVDGIIKIVGISKVMLGEVLLVDNKKYAIALNLERDCVGAIVLGSYINLCEGMEVKCTKKILEIPVGNGLLGRVLNSLGEPIDGKGKLNFFKYSKVEKEAPNVISRSPVNEPVQTGCKAIDSMIPIGKGQRELIIGDRQTGKTTIAVDIIINQKNTGIRCIYVAIGQKMSTVLNIVKILEEKDVLKNTIIVVSSSSDAASLQYLSPYVGCTIGEFFRDNGEDALIIYDDLSKHAIAYRQISLLLRRPPGREAFPGDIFYLHAKLLERSSKVSEEYVFNKTKGKKKDNTGSLTAFPIVETQEGDISSYIPTNIISITDGQIFLESNLFNSGIIPAINPGISVSRVGGSAQTQIMKKMSIKIRTYLSQYRELSSFSKFSSDLDKVSKNILLHGKKLIELFKQCKHKPLSVAEQSLLLFSVENNFLEKIPTKKVHIYEKLLLEYFNKNFFSLTKEINSYGLYNNFIKNQFFKIINNFNAKNFFQNC
ncbi:F0F1 ATP synthase subunit alpha [Buchnera aphidicola (Astegopteryx bambusae)]|uniref:F0F1 ATP synthase subunit alpha n=1 Tax=Buchnera aphidicola TaxID=9 RepID=UPI0031B8678F